MIQPEDDDGNLAKMLKIFNLFDIGIKGNEI